VSTLVAVVLFFVLNLLKTRKDGSVFTASIVSSYIVYIGWSAMASIPNEEWNPFVTSRDNLISQIVIGGFFTFLSLFAISSMSKSESKPDEEQSKAKDLVIEESQQVDPSQPSGTFPVTT
jgi:hypothetical protein